MHHIMSPSSVDVGLNKKSEQRGLDITDCGRLQESLCSVQNYN